MRFFSFNRLKCQTQNTVNLAWKFTSNKLLKPWQSEAEKCLLIEQSNAEYKQGNYGSQREKGRRNRTTMISLRLLSSKSSSTYEITGLFATGSKAFGTSCHYLRTVRNQRTRRRENRYDWLYWWTIGFLCLNYAKNQRCEDLRDERDEFLWCSAG